jgi:hypothetical protein
MALVFLTSGVIYLYLGRWTVTVGDFWGLYDICLNHTWLESALHKHGGHLLFFPSFFWLADLRFFHGNQELLFTAGLTLLFITAGLLLVPIWRDQTVGLTAKMLSTLLLIVGNFWMGRATITVSGGFNCISSLVMVGAALAFLLVPKMCATSQGFLSATLIVVCAGFVASFSFSAGLAIWPTLLFLAWCLRLPRYSVLLLALAGLIAATVLVLLPPHFDASFPITADIAFVWFCRLLGNPVSYAARAWWPAKFDLQLVESSVLAAFSGAIGLALALLALLPKIVRRNVQRSGLEFTGLALTVFSLSVVAIILAGRAPRFRALPFEVAAPRYLFYSPLFWTGLLLIAIHCAESKLWLRWPVYLVALALPVLAFPEHYKSGLNARSARVYLIEPAATSLVNGVRDEQQVKFLFRRPKQIYNLAEQLRLRRLDMFADGLQDWIGINEASLFAGRHERERLNGQCSVEALVECDNGAPAARVTGQMWKRGHIVPKTLVIVDPTGMICGVGRSSAMWSENRFINRTFYLSKFTGSRFLGYIRDYNPQLHYAVRSADDRILSEEKVLVGVPTPNSANP